MDIQDLSKKYQVKELTECDVNDVFSLCVKNPQYYEYCPPAVSRESIEADMKALPPDMTYKDKHYVGFYDNDILVAVMDLIERFPNKDTSFIGFFMMNADLQGKGIGTKVIYEVVEVLKQEFSYIRLGYVKGNLQAESFWMKNGFEKIGIESETDEYTVVVMQKMIR